MRHHLDWRDIEFKNISDPGTKSLAKGFHHMECKNLSHNSVNDSGAEDQLRACISTVRTLLELDLADNNIGNAGLLAHALHHNSS